MDLRAAAAISFFPIGNCPCGQDEQEYNPRFGGRAGFLRIVAEVGCAGVAQLAEHNVANVVVVGSNPITRSWFSLLTGRARPCCSCEG